MDNTFWKRITAKDYERQILSLVKEGIKLSRVDSVDGRSVLMVDDDGRAFFKLEYVDPDSMPVNVITGKAPEATTAYYIRADGVMKRL